MRELGDEVVLCPAKRLAQFRILRKVQHECEGRSREFQDAIFGRRVANPLIFPLIYRCMRPEMEKQMEAGAAALLKDFNGTKA